MRPAALAGLLLICAMVQATGVEFRSGPSRVSLLELYTSEGCSSCPPAGSAQALEVHAALLGFGLDTEVRRGENAGRELRHDFVVLHHQRRSLAARGDGDFVATLPLAGGDEAAERLGVAVWVSRADSPAPLQATGGWLP